MPPKKRKKKQTMTRQRQSQRQSVVVNIGKTTKTRRKSGKGGLPPPSYQHNLTPVVLPQQQVDYSPLILAMMQQPNKSTLQESIPPVNNLQPTASQMAGEAAMSRAEPTARKEEPMSQETLEFLNRPLPTPRVSMKAPRKEEPLTSDEEEEEDIRTMKAPRKDERRPGRTADNFQPLPSKSDERYAQMTQFMTPEPKQNVSGGGGTPTAEVRPKLGAPFSKNIDQLQVGDPVIKEAEAVPYYEPGGGGGGVPIVQPTLVPDDKRERAKKKIKNLDPNFQEYFKNLAKFK